MASGYAIATLVVFLVSIFFVIRPVSIPTPRPLPRIPINLATAPILAIALLWAAQCLDPGVIRNGIVGTEGVKPYNILILFFSLAYMAITLDITGVLQAAAFWVSNRGGSNGWKLYLYFYVMLTLLSILLGNDPVILSGTAFLVYYTGAAELNPTAWIMAEFAAANTASMVLFVGNPTNVVICEGFSVNNAAFTAYTILPFVTCSVFCFVALAFQYRKQVPRKLTRAAHQDPRSALLDPVGACVGSFMLGATLVLCLVVSFFGIDVWMISLPFAFGKCLFDVGWDHYRYSHGIPMLGRGLPRAVGEGLDDDSTVKRHPRTEDGSLRHSDVERSPSFPTDEETPVRSHPTEPKAISHPTPKAKIRTPYILRRWYRSYIRDEDSPIEKHPRPGKGPTPHSKPSLPPDEASNLVPYPTTSKLKSSVQLQPTPEAEIKMPYIFRWSRSYMDDLHDQLDRRFPTIITALPRLPFVLVPFAFSQFILIEALNHQGWVNVFANWLVRASLSRVHPTIWLIGVLDVILCNLSGTNLTTTILLTKVIRAAALPHDTNRAAAIALAVASNIGAVNVTFSASLAGLLWRTILEHKGIHVRQRDFAFWNLLPLLVMTTVGLGIVSAEMAVLF